MSGDQRTAILVRQQHEKGCGAACLAMVTGEPYDDVVAEVTTVEKMAEFGITHYAIQRFLARRGFVWRLWYDRWIGRLQPWPPKPFAPVHIAAVKVGVQTHYVVILDDGSVLCPAATVTNLDDYFVQWVMGIWPDPSDSGSSPEPSTGGSGE